MGKQSAAEELRSIVNMLNSQPEDFNDKYTVDQLIKLGRAYLVDETVPYPAFWTERQIWKALRGTPPCWDINGKPVD